MAEDQAVDEQDQDAQAQEGSTFDRLKGRVKDLVGGDDSEGEQDAEGSGSDSESEGGSEESQAESDGDESAQGEGESDEMVGDYKIDDMDVDARAENEDEARAQIKKLEKEGPPDQLAEWPTGKAMYLTFGGAEGEQGYEDGVARQMGPSSTRHHADGSVEVQGEMVDDPEEYKRDESVTEEADKIGLDKGAKGEDAEESSGEESSGDSGEEQAEGEDSEQADGQSSGEAQGEGETSAEAQGEDSERAEGSGDSDGGDSAGDGSDAASGDESGDGEEQEAQQS